MIHSLKTVGSYLQQCKSKQYSFAAMKLISHLDELPELQKENVHIKNKDLLLEKINKIIRDGAKKLQIVTDFDHTLTKHKKENGEIVLTSFGMLSQCPSIPQEYRDEDERLCSIYKPIEADPYMSKEEKLKHIVDWYIAGKKLLRGIKFPKEELMVVGRGMMDSFRIGVRQMISWCEDKQVPVLVLSAGLGESVVAALETNNLLLPHVKVISNFLSIDENNTITGIKGEMIHAQNKNETAIKHSEYYQLVRDRFNVILMGDNIGDANMNEGMDHCDVVIKIGFLGHKTEGNLENFVDQFDVVLVNEPTMNITNAILKLVL